jgi:hypothetical protein
MLFILFDFVDGPKVRQAWIVAFRANTRSENQGFLLRWELLEYCVELNRELENLRMMLRYRERSQPSGRIMLFEKR